MTDQVLGSIATDELSTRQFLEQQSHAQATNPIAIPQSAMNVQAPVQSPVEVLLGDENVSINKVFTTLMFTYHLSGTDLIGTKNKLQRVPHKVGERVDELNLYSPLRRDSAKKNLPNSVPEGVIRQSLDRIFEVLKPINSANLALVGSDVDVRKRINDVAHSLKVSAQRAIGVKPNTHVFAYVDEDNGSTVNVNFNQLYSISTWVNSETNNGVCEHNIIINFNMQAGVLYDSEDPVKYLTQVDNILKGYLDRQETPVVALLGVGVSVQHLPNGKTLELVSALSMSQNVSGYGFADLASANWAPPKEEAGKVFGKDDMLFVKIVGSDLEDSSVESSAE